MHYQHRYHAGNFADVFKHVLLCGLLRALSRKDKPWRLLDTHAGSGLYDLADEAATRTGEFRDGIGRLGTAAAVPAPVRDYLDRVAGFGGHYPGSPLLGLACAREQDRVAACEKLPAVFAQLKANAGADPRVQLHQRDGYESHALLPPPEKRGLVLIDPPFERPDEFDAVSAYLKKATARWAGGVYAVWYPVKNRHEADRFRRRLMREHPRSGVDLQLHNGAEAEGKESRFASAARGDSERPATDGRAGAGKGRDAAPWTATPPVKHVMTACGLCVLNPPYGWASEMEPALRWLARELAQGPRAEHLVEAWEAAAA